MQCLTDTKEFKDSIFNYDYSVSPCRDIYELYLQYIDLLPTAKSVALEEAYQLIGCTGYGMLEEVDVSSKIVVKLTSLKYKQQDFYVIRFDKKDRVFINQCMIPFNSDEPIIVYLSESVSSNQGIAERQNILSTVHEFTHMVKYINGFIITNAFKDEYATDQVMLYVLDNYLNITPPTIFDDLSIDLFECDDDFLVYQDRLEIGIKWYEERQTGIVGFNS